MKKVNVSIIYNKDYDKILMCYRSKNPYKGKYNFVGGKVEPGEDDEMAAYRELEEETGITKDDIHLMHLMDFSYYMYDLKLEVFVGKLNKDVEVVDEVNHLVWMDKTDDFFNLDKYAGEGNIGHMLLNVDMYEQELFGDQKELVKR